VSPLKKVLKLSIQSINSVACSICCRKNYFQFYPCANNLCFKLQLFKEGGQDFKKHCLLDIHKQIFYDSLGNKMIILEGIDACLGI
jgi:hypothetical protein